MNSSIIGIFLVSFSSFIFGYLIEKINKSSRHFVIILLIFFTLFSCICLFLHARSAFLGGILVLFTTIFNYPNFRLRLIGKGVFICIFFILIFIKKDSSSGRLLIYKVTFSQIKTKDYLYGIGISKFKANYNKFQASYFQNNDINSKEALLAGNGYYLFNDWLQFILELGVLKVICAVYFLWFTLNFFYRNNIRHSIFAGANSCLICLSSAAIFSYPLQVYATGVLFCIALTIHFWFGWKLKDKYNLIIFKNFRNFSLVSLLILLVIYGSTRLIYNQKSTKAFELDNNGFKNEAQRIYKELDKFPIEDYNYDFNKAFYLYMQSELKSALIQIEKSLNIAYSVEALNLKADILFELGKISEAELYYKQAVYITPNKMQIRSKLFRFYIKTGKLESAKFWGNSILSMPIKFQNEKTNEILLETSNTMKSL